MEIHSFNFGMVDSKGVTTSTNKFNFGQASSDKSWSYKYKNFRIKGTHAHTHTHTYTGSRTARWTVKGDERNDSLYYHTTLVKAITPSAEHEINLARV